MTWVNQVMIEIRNLPVELQSRAADLLVGQLYSLTSASFKVKLHSIENKEFADLVLKAVDILEQQYLIAEYPAGKITEIVSQNFSLDVFAPMKIILSLYITPFDVKVKYEEEILGTLPISRLPDLATLILDYYYEDKLRREMGKKITLPEVISQLTNKLIFYL